MRTRTRWLRAAVGTLALAAACGGGGDDGPTEPNANVVGTFTLRTLNGDQLPAVLSIDGGERVDLISEWITFTANQTYTHAVNTRTTVAGQVTTESLQWGGTYTVSGNNITLTRTSDGARASLTHNDGALTMVAAGLTYVYRR